MPVGTQWSSNQIMVLTPRWLSKLPWDHFTKSLSAFVFSCYSKTSGLSWGKISFQGFRIEKFCSESSESIFISLPPDYHFDLQMPLTVNGESAVECFSAVVTVSHSGVSQSLRE